MKKILGAIALAIMVALPMKVNADLSFQFNCEAMDQTTRTKTCEIVGTASGTSTISRFNGTLELRHLTIKTITANSPWTNSSNGTNLVFSAPSNVSNQTFKIATIVFDVDEGVTSEDTCYAAFTPCVDENGNFACSSDKIEITPTYTCKVVNGKYYGKNGNEVTEEVYNSECVSNPQTGSFLPYVVIVSGIALAVTVFTISRKNNKLYKI